MSNNDQFHDYLSLFKAIVEGNLEQVKFLVEEKKLNINVKAGPFISAFLSKYEKIIRNGTPLHYAAALGHFDIVKYLIERGADVNVKDDRGCTPLHYAVERNNFEIVKFLVEKRADVNEPDNFGRTPLHYAVGQNNLELVKLLVNPSTINAKDNNGNTPLSIAVRKGNREIVEYLISQRASIEEVQIRDVLNSPSLPIKELIAKKLIEKEGKSWRCGFDGKESPWSLNVCLFCNREKHDAISPEQLPQLTLKIGDIYETKEVDLLYSNGREIITINPRKSVIVSKSTLEKLICKEGDSVLLQTKDGRKAIAVIKSGNISDDKVIIDEMTQENLSVNLGDEIMIRRIIPEIADEIVLKPLFNIPEKINAKDFENLILYFVTEEYNNKPLKKGEKVWIYINNYGPIIDVESNIAHEIYQECIRNNLTFVDNSDTFKEIVKKCVEATITVPLSFEVEETRPDEVVKVTEHTKFKILLGQQKEEQHPPQEVEAPKILPMDEFLNRLKTTTNWKEFEDGVYKLLKLIGINDVYPYRRQKGTSDGVFAIRNFVVIYDVTLDENFEQNKSVQIENYVNILSKNSNISIPNKIPKEISLTNKDKEVWIITRGKSRIIKTRDNIKVKEISVYDLIDIYAQRLEDDTFDEDVLVNRLKALGENLTQSIRKSSEYMRELIEIYKDIKEADKYVDAANKSDPRLIELIRVLKATRDRVIALGKESGDEKVEEFSKEVSAEIDKLLEKIAKKLGI